MSADLQMILRQGMGALQQGRWDEAALLFRVLCGKKPDAPEPLYYLGIALLSGGKPGEAVEALSRLVREHGDNPMALNALGSAQAAGGGKADAEQSFRRALALAPDLGDAADNLTRLLLETGRAAEALPLLRDLLAREPGRVPSRYLLGRALRDTGDPEGAMAAFRAVLEAQPNFPAAINDLGLLHYACGQGQEALDCFERLLRLNPADPVAANNRAIALRVLDRLDEAEQQYRSLLKRFPDAPEVNLNLGKLLARSGRLVDSVSFLEKGNTIEARWWNALVLPNQYETEEQVTRWRQRYADKLSAVAAEIAALPPASLPAQAGILELDIFFLAYQGENDRDLNALLRSAQSRVIQACHGHGASLPLRRSTGRVRVGFLSSCFHFHVVGKLMNGWITGLDRSEFEVFLFHANKAWDQETDRLSGAVEHFVDAYAPTEEKIRMVREADLDVLIYPDIGLNPKTDTLAMLRLAPVQCATFAHPVTTGMASIDYFLSGELIEPEGADGHYTEKLVRLPGIGFNLARPEVDEAVLPPARDASAGPLFFCAQSLYKLLPRRDEIFARIAKAVGPCTIDFIDRFGIYTDTFRKRMDKAFAAHGLEAEQFIRIHGLVTAKEFLGLLKASDVSLDSLDWSGGHTTMEALSCGTPIVAGTGRFLRGNVSAGILRAAGLDELVVSDEDAYVALAARLGTDGAYRERISRAMLANGAQVFESRAPVDGLAAFLKSVARPA